MDHVDTTSDTTVDTTVDSTEKVQKDPRLRLVFDKTDKNGLHWTPLDSDFSGFSVFYRVFREMEVPDPYHGVPHGSAPYPHTPLPRVPPPPTQYRLLSTPRCQQARHRSPGFFRIQSGSQNSILSVLATFLSSKNGPVKMDTFVENPYLILI